MANVYKGTFKISNVAWDERLGDKSSDMFRDMSDDVHAGLEDSLIPRHLRNEADFDINIMEFEAGSVIVHYRISWQFNNYQDENPISRDVFLRQLDTFMTHENNLLSGIYSVDEKSHSINCKSCL